MTIASSSVRLSLYRLESSEGWEKRIADVISRDGYVVAHGGKVWLRNERRQLSSGIDYCDGFHVSAVRLGPGFHGLAITPHLYFFEDGAAIPSSKPSWGLLKEPSRLVSSPLAQRLEKMHRLHSCLVEAGCGVHQDPIDLQESRSDLLDNVRIVAGSRHVEHNVGESMGRILQQNGFQNVPLSFEILLCSPAGNDFRVGQYSRHLTKAFARIRCQCEVKVVSWGDIVHMLESHTDTNANYASPQVLLLGVHGTKGCSLRAAEASALRQLDERGVSYRLFSLENPAMNWSAFDQVSILCEAVHGKAYSVKLPFDDADSPIVFLGLDLGHPLDSKVSWAVATIVDSDGHLLGYWRHRQERDETLRTKTLVAALNWIYLILRKRYRGQCKVIVFRDGRLFENERTDLYAQFFGKHHTLVEVIKHPVPLMLVGNTCAPAGTVCIPRGSVFSFVLTSRSKNHTDVNLPLKIRVVYDGLEIGQHGVSQIIAGLSFAPTLGLNPIRSPVPIYWANGLASISETNHQFSGIHWVAHS